MRVRAGRSILAAALAAGLLVGAASTGIAGARPTAASPLRLQHIYMFSARTGWATTNTSVLRTMDGGRTWMNSLTATTVRTPIPFAGVAFTALGPNHAWAVELLSGGPIRTFETKDGGHTWHRYVSKALTIPSDTSSAQLTFADGRHGWLLVNSNPGAGSDTVTMMMTSNGGRTWATVDRFRTCNGSVNHLSFVDAKLGFTTGLCGAAANRQALFRTRNAGHAWKRFKVPTPGLKVRFFNPGGVFARVTTLLMPVALRSPSSFVLFTSSDRGASWHETMQIREKSRAMLAPAFSFYPLNDTLAWVLMKHRMWQTTDQGLRWFVINRHTPFHAFQLGVEPQIDFVNVYDGFVLPSPGSSSLYVSTNSGNSWKRVSVRLQGM